MRVILKSDRDFSDWEKMRNFLEQSPCHFLVSESLPQVALGPCLARRLLLRGLADPQHRYHVVPRHISDKDLQALCVALLNCSLEEPQLFIGSVPINQFIAFLHQFSERLKGEVEREETAHAIIEKT